MHDVIVVGAGPAGAVAARQLALLGRSTLLLEKAPTLPRDRVCAGVVTPGLEARLARLDLGIQRALIQTTLTRITVRVPGGPPLAVDLSPPGWFVIRRGLFDHRLVEAAVEAGARFQSGWRVDRVERVEENNGRGWRVHGGGAIEEGRVVILATGALDALAASVGIPPAAGGTGLAFELDASNFRGRSQQLVIEVGGLPHGFFWMIPAGPRVMVGLASTRVRIPHARRLLNAFLDRHDLAHAGILSSQTGFLPASPPARPAARPGLAWVGDLCPIVDPLTGLGMDGAVRSGAWIADAVHRALASSRADPGRFLRGRMRQQMRDYRVAERAAETLYRSPLRFLEALALRPGLARRLGHCVAGIRPYRTLTGKLWPTAFDRFVRRVGR